MRRILVTGAKGMLGQDLCPMLDQNGFEVIPADYQEMDITDLKQVESFIRENSPGLIIHCAAYTNVDKAEEDKDNAFLINEKGSENLAKVSGENSIPIVAISTDYVFDGTANKPYTPEDKTNPINVYGASKLAGELAIRKYNPMHYIARTSWLYGIHGKNFVETMLSLAEKLPQLKVVNDQVGCPTWTVALSYGILNLIRQEMPYGIYHLCGSGYTSWHGFAEKIFELSNIDKTVNPCSTEEFPRPASRPKYSVMDNKGMLPAWEDSLKNYLQLRNMTK